MKESHRQLEEKVREALAKGGPGALLDILSGMGVSTQKEPEAGVGLRMRSGAGTADGFTTTMYKAASERPDGWPADIPFLPNVGGSLTLFEQPGRGYSVQWWQVPDPVTAAQLLIDQCLAAGWRRQEAPTAMPPVGPPDMQTVTLERDGVTRILASLAAKGIGFVQLMERRPGPSGGTGPTPTGP